MFPVVTPYEDRDFYRKESFYSLERQLTRTAVSWSEPPASFPNVSFQDSVTSLKRVGGGLRTFLLAPFDRVSRVTNVTRYYSELAGRMSRVLDKGVRAIISLRRGKCGPRNEM